MNKRGGDISIEWESSERKRLRNTLDAVSHSSWVVDRVTEDQRCSMAISELVHGVADGMPLSHLMDRSVQLVQHLKQLQSLDTPSAHELFEIHYGSVLGYIGNVIDRIGKLDGGMVDDDDDNNDDSDSVLLSFVGIYQYLVEMIAKHSSETQKCVAISLIATLLSTQAYSDESISWTTAAYAWHLSQCTDTGLRLIAWSLFPLFCLRMSQQGKDGFLAVSGHSKITVNDPEDLLEVVANSIGYLACARSGCLTLRTCNGELPCLGWGLSKEPVSVSEYALGIASIYSCSSCDLPEQSRQQTKNKRESVSLSSWVPYWFIASRNLRGSTSVQFVRGVSRFVRHADIEDLGLKDSPLGRGIVRRLSSSDREIRLAAVDAILAYSCEQADDSEQILAVKRANRLETICTLKDIARGIEGSSIVEETLELVAGGIGCACPKVFDDSALSMAMQFLVSYFCGENVFLRSVAMEQMLLIAKKHGVSPSRLLTLHASSVACTLASTLNQQIPRPFMHCLRMMDTTPGEFLCVHQDLVVPHLVAEGNEEALKNVADILKVRLPVLCVNQAPVVFVKIFLMDDQLMHQALSRFVRLISEGVGNGREQVEVNIPTLLRSCSVKLIFNLVLSLGEEDTVLRKRARSALLTVQSILDGSTAENESQGVSKIVQQSVENLKDVSNKESPRPGRQASVLQHGAGSTELAGFLSQHILGVMAYVNELLRDVTETAAGDDEGSGGSRIRRKVLRAIGELVALLGSRSTPHTNNIVASLTPSLQGPLAEPALNSWAILSENLATASLSVDQINALLVPLITAFVACGDPQTRTKAAGVIGLVVTQHKHSIKLHGERVCPIPDDPLLADARATLQSLVTRGSLRHRLLNLTQMLKARDSTMILCVSREICTLLRQNEKQVSQWKQPFAQEHAGELDNIDELKSRSKDRSAGGAQTSPSSDARLISSIVEALKAACSYTKAAHQLGELAAASCAACLAVIGVVDTQALDNKTRSINADPAKAAMAAPSIVLPSLQRLQTGDDRVEFACTLIVDYLAHAFAVAPSPGVQTCAAYGIQELLRLVGFTKDLVSSDSESTDSKQQSAASKRKKRDVGKRSGRENTQLDVLRERWNMLPANVIEVIKPLLESKYTIQGGASRKNNALLNGQLKRTACISKATSYIGWLRAWVVELVNALPESSPAEHMFKVCTSAIKESEADMLLFLLPQAVYQLCLHANDVSESKITEMSRKSGSARSGNGSVVVYDEDNDSGSEIEPKDTGSSLQDGISVIHAIADEVKAVFLLDAASATSVPGDQLRQCKEVGLNLLDTLNNHVRAQQLARVSDKRSSRKDSELANATPEESRLLALVNSVSHSTIAQVAASCHQYERALLHTELSLRENTFGKYPTLFGHVSDENMSVIQELYFSMGNVDGVIGASLCRRQTNYMMNIRKYEVEGNWSHALIGHESLLRAQPDNEGYQRSWISCLQNMGQWEGAWATSKELYRKEPANDDERQLNSACFAAAWRLGKWDWVEKTMQDSELPSRGQTLPEFNALSSAMLLRLGRDDSLGALHGLALPLPLVSIPQAVSTGNRNSSSANGTGSSATSEAKGILGLPFAKIAELALISIGQSTADSSVLRGSTLVGAKAGVTAASSAPSDVCAHMLGDVVIMANTLDPMDYGASCRELSGRFSELFERWRRRVLCLPEEYSVQEPILMLHSRLYDMLLEHMGNSSSSSSNSDKSKKSHRHYLPSEGGKGCECAELIMGQKVRTNLQAAQLARLAGFRATAMGILVHAELTCSATPVLQALMQIEHAQILWEEGHSADAISSLTHVADGLQEQLNIPTLSATMADGTPNSRQQSFQQLSSSRSRSKDEETMDDIENAYARAMLPLLSWQMSTNAISPVILSKRYEQITSIHESDRAYYAMGRLNDTLFNVAMSKNLVKPKSKNDSTQRQIVMLQFCLIRYYLRSILQSSRFLFQALPRLLTVWFDFSETSGPIPEKADSKKDPIGFLTKQIDTMITNMTSRLPMYNFLVVLSQLVSRICHPKEEVFRHLQNITLHLLELYPQQTLWQLMGVQRSTFAARAQRCNMILDMARSISGPSGKAKGAHGVGSGGGGGYNRVGSLIEQASKLTDWLLGLSNAAPRNNTTMHMSRDFPQLAKCKPLNIIVPLQQSMVPTLPSTPANPDCELALAAPGFADSSSDDIGGLGGASSPSLLSSQRAMMHQPFSGDLPTISGFENEIAIMPSLIKPKKITMIGSDGKRYSFLCKPKDDLRKDSRLMEFNSMINRLLNSDSETQKRGLHIRTYAVVPLNEECGLIQWIAPTTAIRHVLYKIYKARKVSISMEQVKSILNTPSTTRPHAETFTDVLLPLFPSVLHEWFLQSFPDPHLWLLSRTNFTRSTAVMSMVGYILGLGDRHNENILLDESTGGVVHVDFNCLFEKGLKLEKPERVPFRLTHNIVDAMGVTGYEGTFRKTCEMTLGLLRDNRDALMSVLEAFLHDPLVEWSKPATRASRGSAAIKDGVMQQPNVEATKSLGIISRKLQGNYLVMSPLSVEGQVDALIREATSPERLFQMYIGWAAYM
ncbi:hypothetical protein GGI07_001933 [Coemansia sp. Benny D115]|nr:hypothetical protein GGI07_001933 [Coemansia sp. Benny D115]